jgi:hypothetical protein
MLFIRFFACMLLASISCYAEFIESTSNDPSVPNLTEPVTHTDASPTLLLNEDLNPVITGLNPPKGSANGNDIVVIEGKHLADITTVTFDGVAATILIASDTQVIVRNPAGSGRASVSVQTATQEITAKKKYSYVPLPVITDLSARSGSIKGGNQIKIKGKHLKSALLVRFGLMPAKFVVNSNTVITATVPAGFVGGAVDIKVVTLGGAVTSPYTYIPHKIKLKELDVVSGSKLGGNTLTMTGSYLNSISAVYFGGKAAVLSTISENAVVLQVPAGELGPVDVRIITPFEEVNLKQHYTYKLPAATYLKCQAVKNKFATHSNYTHHLSWGPSPDVSVVRYQIVRNGHVIGTVSAQKPLQYSDKSRPNKDTYEIFALDAKGNKSMGLKLDITK